MGGDNSLENCTVLCLSCDLGKKTPKDISEIAKVKRIEAKHRGIRKPTAFPCGRNSKFKRKINGQIVLR